MPKKKIISRDEPVSARPHRNMKAKVVFDPSDNHIPKKRAKYSYKNEKPVETTTVRTTTTVKKTTNDRRKKQDTTKSKSLPVNPVTEVTELLDSPSTKINTISPVHSPINSPVNSVTTEVTQEISKNCFVCSTVLEKTELIDCPICLIKAHKNCLIINEPIWKFKLDLCHWLCGQCRKQNCSKCLKDESQSMIKRRCLTCGVGLHTDCYESYEIKPLHKFESDVYVCIPCMTLAAQVNPEEKDEVEVKEPIHIIEDDVESLISSIVCISSDEDDTDSKSYKSYSSSDYEEYNEIKNNDNIPNISKWTKDQVFEYLSEHLSQEIIDQIIIFNLDGRALQLLNRTDITSKMGLKLGHALKFYKQVRILQSQNTFSHIFWD